MDRMMSSYGIIILMVVEVGSITRPVGLNVFLINSLSRDVPMIDTFKGFIPLRCAGRADCDLPGT